MNSESKNLNFGQPDANNPLLDVLDALPEGIAVFGPDLLMVTCNQRYIDMFPLVADKIVPGAHWDDFLQACVDTGQIIDPFDDPKAFMNRAMTNRFNFDREVVAQHIDGKNYLVRFSQTESGGYVVSRHEITDHEQAERMVRDRETLLATVLDTTPIAVVMARQEDGLIVYRSHEARQMLGETTYAHEHYLSESSRKAYLHELKKTGTISSYPVTLVRSDGSSFPAVSSGRIVEFGGFTCVVSAIADQTHQLERDALIRHILESCPTPIQMVNAGTGEILFSTPETIALFGQADDASSHYVVPSERERFLSILREREVVHEHKAEFYNQNGEPFWASVSARLIRYDGNEVIVSHTRDLTEQIKIENELSVQQDMMFQNEKMSALGELLAGVAHELNNPLSVVVGHSLMLKEDTKDPEVLRQVGKISGSAVRCAKIVKTFLTMARQQPSKSEEININDIVRTAVDVASYGELSSQVNIECDLFPSLPNCCADGDQITQVIINLILNAEQAIHDGKKGNSILVRTALDSRKGMVVIEVEDNGPGIPDSLQNRIFEPFFTTREVGDGTGIGLTLSHRIIRSHNGQITLDKTLKTGTRFRVTIPAIETKEKPGTAKGTVTQSSDSSRILIVDDEVDVADLNAEILTRSGFEVDVANTAQDGVSLLSKTQYDLVLSDLNMPEMDGRGFFDTIKERHPEMIKRTGFITGDTMGKGSQTFLRDAQRPYLEKPASPKELRAFVSDILQQAGASE